MRCHEVLGIKETATTAEIKGAYERKTQLLEENSSILSPESIEQKRNELTTAREECLSWCHKSAFVQIKERVTESFSPKPGTVRLYEMCCGPFTCMDGCLGVCGNGCCWKKSPTCTDAICGFQFSIFCDLGLYAFFAWLAYKDHEEKKAQAAKDVLIARANLAREENEKINAQLSQCLTEQTQYLLQIKIAGDKLRSVDAFSTMFTEFGALEGQDIFERQRNELIHAQNVLSTNRKKEAELRDKIKENQRTIDLAN